MTATAIHPETARHFALSSLTDYGFRVVGGLAGAAVLAVSVPAVDHTLKAERAQPIVAIEQPAGPAGGTIMAVEQVQHDVGRDHTAFAEGSRLTFLKQPSD